MNGFDSSFSSQHKVDGELHPSAACSCPNCLIGGQSNVWLWKDPPCRATLLATTRRCPRSCSCPSLLLLNCVRPFLCLGITKKCTGACIMSKGVFESIQGTFYVFCGTPFFKHADRMPDLRHWFHLGVDVSESQGRIVLINDVRRDLLEDNLIKNGWSALISSCPCPAIVKGLLSSTSQSAHGQPTVL